MLGYLFSLPLRSQFRNCERVDEGARSLSCPNHNRNHNRNRNRPQGRAGPARRRATRRSRVGTSARNAVGACRASLRKTVQPSRRQTVDGGQGPGHPHTHSGACAAARDCRTPLPCMSTCQRCYFQLGDRAVSGRPFSLRPNAHSSGTVSVWMMVQGASHVISKVDSILQQSATRSHDTAVPSCFPAFLITHPLPQRPTSLHAGLTGGITIMIMIGSWKNQSVPANSRRL